MPVGRPKYRESALNLVDYIEKNTTPQKDFYGLSKTDDGYIYNNANTQDVIRQ